MDMSSMGGMSMSSNPVFRHYDERLAKVFWYIVVTFAGIIILIRIWKWWEMRLRIRRIHSKSIKYPTHTQNLPSKILATATAITRELTYPQLHLPGIFSWLSPPSLGQSLLLLIYWAILTYLLTTQSIIHDAEYYERIGFRAAWISLSQIPLIYLLSSKINILAHLTGTSYERINWLHRWVSRSLLVTVAVHAGFFLREWMIADFVAVELQMMPMVKYGIGAWFILLWTFLSSLGPLRTLCYEVFVLQHLVSACVFLWAVWVHVPKYAAYYVWFSIGAFAFDWVARGLLLVWCNIHKGGVGYVTELETEGESITVLSMADVGFSWGPGQHIRVWVPRIGLLETHPLTIATIVKLKGKGERNKIQLVLRTQKGFSRRINRYAEHIRQGRAQPSVRAFISGPYGSLPNWNAYETLVLISASTGGSFTIPILEHVLVSEGTCVQRVRVLLLARRKTHISFYTQRIGDLLARAEALGIDLRFEIAITKDEEDVVDVGADASESLLEAFGESPDRWGGAENEKEFPGISEKAVEREGSARRRRTREDEFRAHLHEVSTVVNSTDVGSSITGEQRRSLSRGADGNFESMGAEESREPIVYSSGRPDIGEFIRSPIEATGGETSVVVCGGKSLVAEVKNCVMRLSDERAVHKGTGAQGIFLYAEEYCL